jgi:putative transposase
MAFDWGIEHFLTLAETDDAGAFRAGDVLAATIRHIANPRILNGLQTEITALQQDLARKTRGSTGWRKAADRLARRRQYEGRCRKDFVEKETADLAVSHHTIITEAFAVSAMTRSARGTVENPGRNVAQKAGLNRSILDTCPRFTLNRLRLKAEEAAGVWIELNTRVEAPSQHCICGSRRRKDLDERTHQCLDCGHVEQRDAASARYILGRVYGLVRAPKKKQKTKRVPAVRIRAPETHPVRNSPVRAQGAQRKLREPNPEPSGNAGGVKLHSRAQAWME